MVHKIQTILFLTVYIGFDSANGDPGRDVCKIVPGPGLKCSKISSNLFPYDTFLSFNDDLAQFTNDMKYLEVKHSNITVLQGRSFQRTPHLSHLILSDINLMEIEPGAFEGLRRLKSVDLSYNLLQVIPVDTFMYAKLNHLKLDGNMLLAMPTNGSVLNSKTLTWLSLKECNIQHLPASAFQQNPSLIYLDLSKNYLQALPGDIFSGLQHLSHIDLSENKFRSLEIKIFESIPFYPTNPTSVILSGNPWVCDCRIAKLGDWLTKNIKTGDRTETPGLSRLKKSVECQHPHKMSWNSAQFKNLIDSCKEPF